ncbi:MAG: SRPBCC family protein [Candidatus Nanopelagicales bacterium]
MPAPDPSARERRHLTLDVVIDAPPETVFAAVTDWPGQGRWMLGTRVQAVGGDGTGEGARLEAWTGTGRVGFLDTMTITRWDPPRRVDVLHTGRVVRGTGTMEVVALPGGRSRFVWSEDLDLPLGLLGRAGWPLVRPAFAQGVRRSLREFARLVEAGELPEPAAGAG